MSPSIQPVRAVLLALLAVALSPPALGADAEKSASQPPRADGRAPKLLGKPSMHETQPPPAHVAMDPGAPVVTAKNVLESERFWPYRVFLVSPWQPPGEGVQSLKRGHFGVLIRVEESGNPRIDFGMRGKYEVPIAKTDLLTRANAIRLGTEGKDAPNFVYAIRTRLIDASAETPSALEPEHVHGHEGFLCVFADPGAEGFPELAAALKPLFDRHGVMTIFFPIGQHPDGAVRKQLRELGWTPPYLFDFLSEAYIRSLVPPDTKFPAVLLQTDEGRMLYFGKADAEHLTELASALDARFSGEGAAPPAMAAERREPATGDPTP